MAEPERPTHKHVDEDWKERVEQEKSHPAPEPAPGESRIATPAAHAPAEQPPVAGQEAGPIEARFDVFVSGLSMEALIALGDLPHPTTKKRGTQLPQAKYLIDLLGILEEKTRGNLSAEESQLLQDLLYQLRMRYLAKSEGPTPS